jgi:hypothetical protein
MVKFQHAMSLRAGHMLYNLLTEEKYSVPKLAVFLAKGNGQGQGVFKHE